MFTMFKVNELYVSVISKNFILSIMEKKKKIEI